ncbi:MAG: DUF192 domain-containing protein [Deltaproteobacteria bacterium]|nr:DUF192 domain-containing protein [Deltaproteobacteria bacterium]MBI3390101.1 DUF192 domain-containing protein [Deltaproteobacteria bacterium]
MAGATLLVAALALGACTRGPTVVILAADNATVRVEVVSTPSARAQGLMYRRELTADAGMLFIFPADGVQHFWMKNTLMPLDMLFIDRERRIVGIVENARPMSTEPVGPDTPARYVLEVNGGFAAQHHVSTGAMVEFIDIPEGAS